MAFVSASGSDVKSLGFSTFPWMLHCHVPSLPPYTDALMGVTAPFTSIAVLWSALICASAFFLSEGIIISCLGCFITWVDSPGHRLVAPRPHLLLLYNKFLPVEHKRFTRMQDLLYDSQDNSPGLCRTFHVCWGRLELGVRGVIAQTKANTGKNLRLAFIEFGPLHDCIKNCCGVWACVWGMGGGGVKELGSWTPWTMVYQSKEWPRSPFTGSGVKNMPHWCQRSCCSQTPESSCFLHCYSSLCIWNQRSIVLQIRIKSFSEVKISGLS